MLRRGASRDGETVGDWGGPGQDSVFILVCTSNTQDIASTTKKQAQPPFILSTVCVCFMKVFKLDVAFSFQQGVQNQKLRTW